MMEPTAEVIANAHQLVARAGGAPTDNTQPPVYRTVGIILALASGVFIGISFVLKKMGLLKANVKYNEEAGEGYGYLKNVWWWSGMTMMIVGEVCNFAAYAFVDPIIVTPLGALSVVITTILSAIFLKERLSFVGKVGCFNCIIGSIVIVLNAPKQSAVADIQEMKRYVVAPGFLTYAAVIVVGCTFIAFWVAPRYGKKSMLVYISICSLIGGLSVVCTQGLGAAILTQARGIAQFNQWFLYVILVFFVATLLVEIVYLNKALNIFNAALVTPTYYVFFTSATIVTSAILFQGFKGTPMGIATVIMGFLQICAGVVLLQMSKSAKDVPDAAVFKGDLDQIREIGEQEQPESEPKADAIRGTAAIIRRISMSRQKKEEEEARRYHEEKMKEQLEPLAENETVEWDGLRRRKTILSDGAPSPLARQKTIHPPLGMSRFPDESDQAQEDRDSHSFLDAVRSRASSVLRSHQSRRPASDSREADGQAHIDPVALADIKVSQGKHDGSTKPYAAGSLEEAQEHIYGRRQGVRPPDGYQSSGQPSPRSKPLPAQPTVQSPAGAPNIPLPSPLGKFTRRQFSFQNIFRNTRSPSPGDEQSAPPNLDAPPSRSGIGSKRTSAEQKLAVKTATEEERLGLVKGDSHAALLDSDPHSSSDHDSDPYSSPPRPLSHELKYLYEAPPQHPAPSSPEAHTSFVPKHSYLLSTSTIDKAPYDRELQTPTSRGSRYGSTSPPPVREQEQAAGVDHSDWQIPSDRRNPQRQLLHPHPPPTSRFPQQHLSPTTASPFPLVAAAAAPTPPPHTDLQLPAYHSTNPFFQPQQIRQLPPPLQQQQQQPQPQPLHASAPHTAPPAAASAPFPNTPTTTPNLQTMIPDPLSSYRNTTTGSGAGAGHSGSEPLSSTTTTSLSPPRGRESRVPAGGSVEEQRSVGIGVSRLPEEVQYEERRRRFLQKRNGKRRGDGQEGVEGESR